MYRYSQPKPSKGHITSKLVKVHFGNKIVKHTNMFSKLNQILEHIYPSARGHSNGLYFEQIITDFNVISLGAKVA